ncbi:MAG: hypothetical protein CR993_07520 [Rhodobacterales bacterium]|nr:MAG: hypothetical protein CR993_07520 [Rhodobacterales bacterium]
MKRQPGIAVLGLGALAAGAVGVVLLWPSEMAEFTFPAVDGQGSLTYQCYPAVTPQQTELNARAAHAFFEPELRDANRRKTIVAAPIIAKGPLSPEREAELDAALAQEEARFEEIHQRMQDEFGCIFHSVG